MMTPIEEINKLFDDFIAEITATYTEYDNNSSTELTESIVGLFKSAIEQYKIGPVTDDLIQQFKNPVITDTRTVTDEDGSETEEEYERKSNTYAVCYAIDKQIVELECIFLSILLITNLDYATGKQLDNIGDILNLSRAEAALLCGNTIYFTVLDDEPYRRYLKYKAIINSNDCTYYTLMKALKVVLGDSTDVEYTEDENYPATILLDVTTSENSEVYLQAIPPIKPAGVSVSYLSNIIAKIEVAMSADVYKADSILCGTHYCGTYPVNIESVIKGESA